MFNVHFSLHFSDIALLLSSISWVNDLFIGRYRFFLIRTTNCFHI